MKIRTLALATILALSLSSSALAGNPLKGCTQKDAAIAQQILDKFQDLLDKNAMSKSEFLNARIAYIDVVTCHDASALDYCVEKGKALDELVKIHEQAIANGLGISNGPRILGQLAAFRTHCP